MIKVLDNFIDDDQVIEKLWTYFLFESPHFFEEQSAPVGCGIKSTNIFYHTDFNLEDEIIKVLYLRVFDFLNLDEKKYKPKRINTNIQHFGMGLDSDFHTDATEFTAVYFLSPQIEGGEFVYKENNIEKKIEYKQDRLLVFDGAVEHKALPPSNLTARVSLAFKIDKLC